jgi:thioredoxin reductase (NADPH)
MHLSRYASRVTILVRGDSLAESMSQYLLGEIAATPNVDVRLRATVAGGSGEGRLEHVTLRDGTTGELRDEEAVALFVLIGGHPHSDWLPAEVARDRWGYVLTGREAEQPGRVPVALETTMPRVFAVGDVRSHSTKRVASAVGEGSVVIRQVHECLAAAGVAAPAATR